MTLRDIVVCFGGVFLGFMGCVFLVALAITTIGEAFHVENMNLTVVLNQTYFEEVTRNASGYQNAGATPEVWTGSDEDIHKLRYIMATEYDRGFIAGIEAVNSNILFSGSTFDYPPYVVKLRDTPSSTSAEIAIYYMGYETNRSICYEYQWCNIGNVSFKIDDIYIGKEAAYLVYWSDK